jgi:hypothetical protein
MEILQLWADDALFDGPHIEMIHRKMVIPTAPPIFRKAVNKVGDRMIYFGRSTAAAQAQSTTHAHTHSTHTQHSSAHTPHSTAHAAARCMAKRMGCRCAMRHLRCSAVYNVRRSVWCVWCVVQCV